MCALEDLINSTTGSADSMTSTLKDYGNDSMGSGIRKAVDESYANGYNDCFDTEVPKAYDKGYTDCLENEVPKAHAEGMLEGAIIALAVAGLTMAISFVKGKITNYKVRKNNKKKSVKTDNEPDVLDTEN